MEATEYQNIAETFVLMSLVFKSSLEILSNEFH